MLSDWQWLFSGFELTCWNLKNANHQTHRSTSLCPRAEEVSALAWSGPYAWMVFFWRFKWWKQTSPWTLCCLQILCRLLSWISSLILDMLHVLYLFLKGSCRPHTARLSGLENMKWRSTQWPPKWEAETHVLFAAETSWSISPTSRISHHFKRHPWHQALILSFVSFCHMKCFSSFSNIAIAWNIKKYQKHSTFTTHKDNKTQQLTSTSSNQTPDFGGPKPCSCRSRFCSCSSSCWCGWRFPRFLRDVVTPPTIHIWILKHETYVICEAYANIWHMHIYIYVILVKYMHVQHCSKLASEFRLT